jgi:hypothetical protein
MSDIVLVAIVGFAGIIGTGVLSPLVLGWLNARSRIREKEEGPSRWPGAAGESSNREHVVLRRLEEWLRSPAPVASSVISRRACRATIDLP